MQLQIARLGRLVVEQQHGAAMARETVLEREDLPAITQRGLRQQAQFRQAVEDEPRRPLLLDLLQDAAGSLSEFELGRMQQGLFLLGAEIGLGHQLDNRDAVERPAMGRGRGPQLIRRLGQRDVHAVLPHAQALQQEPQRERRFAGARRALDQVEAIACQTACENVIETGNTGQSPVSATRIGGQRARCLSHSEDSKVIGGRTRDHPLGRA